MNAHTDRTMFLLRWVVEHAAKNTVEGTLAEERCAIIADLLPKLDRVLDAATNAGAHAHAADSKCKCLACECFAAIIDLNTTKEGGEGVNAERDNTETEFAPTRRGVVICHERAALNWRRAMRCHALMWKRQRGTRGGGLALQSARICRTKAIEAVFAALDAQREAR